MAKMPDFGFSSKRFQRESITFPIRMHFILAQMQAKMNPMLHLGEILGITSQTREFIETKIKPAELVLDEFEKTDMTVDELKIKLQELGFKTQAESVPK